MKLFIRFEMPYFSFIWSSFFFPESIWSLWRSRKFLAVDAALRASLVDTEVGSRLNECAVRTACCFCCMVVPWAGVAAAGEVEVGDDVFILENRAWSSFCGAYGDASPADLEPVSR